MSTGIPFPPLSPEIFSISLFGIELALRWYALAYIAGILIGWRIMVQALRHPILFPEETAPMEPRLAEDLLTYMVLGIVLGGRLGFVLFYDPAHYLSHPSEILRIWQGGMAFHGGFVGVVIATILFCRRTNAPVAQVSDLLAIIAPVGLLLGRLANFINAELWGRPTDLPWGVIFPGEAAQTCGQIAGLCARHPSQLYEAALEGLLLGGMLLWLAFRRGMLKAPWRATGLFLAGYGAGRFLVEFVRQPDAQFISPGNPLGLAFHVHGYGLTMGQILSLPMLVLGILVILRTRRNNG